MRRGRLTADEGSSLEEKQPQAGREKKRHKPIDQITVQQLLGVLAIALIIQMVAMTTMYWRLSTGAGLQNEECSNRLIQVQTFKDAEIVRLREDIERMKLENNQQLQERDRLNLNLMGAQSTISPIDLGQTTQQMLRSESLSQDLQFAATMQDSLIPRRMEKAPVQDMRSQYEKLYLQFVVMKRERDRLKARELTRLNRLPSIPDSELASLPPPWTAHEHPSGRIYYHNHASGESSWLDPRELRFPFSGFADSELSKARPREPKWTDSDCDSASRPAMLAREFGAEARAARSEAERHGAAYKRGFLSLAGPKEESSPPSVDQTIAWSLEVEEVLALLDGDRLWFSNNMNERGDAANSEESGISFSHSIDLYQSKILQPETGSRTDQFILRDRFNRIWIIALEDSELARDWILAIRHNIKLMHSGALTPRQHRISHKGQKCSPEKRNRSRSSADASLPLLATENVSLTRVSTEAQSLEDRVQFWEKKYNKLLDQAGTSKPSFHSAAGILQQSKVRCLIGTDPDSIPIIDQLWRPGASVMPEEYKQPHPDSLTSFKELLQSHGWRVAESSLALYPEYSSFLKKQISLPETRTVCQAGYETGFSASYILANDAKTKVIVFADEPGEFFQGTVQNVTAEFLCKAHWGRIGIVRGLASETLAAVSKQLSPEPICDLSLVVGNRHRDVAELYQEVKNLRSISPRSGLILFDGAPCHTTACSQRLFVVNKLADEGMLKILSKRVLDRGRHGFIAATFDVRNASTTRPRHQPGIKS